MVTVNEYFYYDPDKVCNGTTIKYRYRLSNEVFFETYYNVNGSQFDSDIITTTITHEWIHVICNLLGYDPPEWVVELIAVTSLR